MSNNQSIRRSGEQAYDDLLEALRAFISQFGLAWQLLWDSRVPLLTKLVPVFTLAYLISPLDLVPDAVLGAGQVDDLALLLLGVRLFIALCPPAIVEELKRGSHSTRLEQVEGEIIDLEPRQPAD